MDADTTAKILDATAKLLGVLVWPAVIGYILVRFGSKIGDLISSLSEVTLEVLGVKAIVKRRQSEATAALVAASTSKTEPATTPESLGNAAKEAVQAVAGLNFRSLRRIEDSRVLGVDDNPENNIYERQSLEALGVRFVLSTSTADALSKTKNQQFDAIISDMGRPPDRYCGLHASRRIAILGGSDAIHYLCWISFP